MLKKRNKSQQPRSLSRLLCAGSTSEAARIIYPPASRTMTVRKGHRLVLECVASGTPTPQVTWAKDGRELSPQNNTRFLLSNLLIDAVSDGDSGTYACHAHNGMGSPGTATVLYDVQVIGEYWGRSGTRQEGCVLTGHTVCISYAFLLFTKRRLFYVSYFSQRKTGKSSRALD